MKVPSAWQQTLHWLWVGWRVGGLVLGLRLLFPCLNLQTLLKWLTPSASSRGEAAQTLEHAVWWTDTLLRFVFPWQGKCLPRTLTLYFMATRSGYPVQAHCGVRRDGSKLQGHAWLSLHGSPFLEQDNPGQPYTSIFSFPQATCGVPSSSPSPTPSGFYQ